MQQLDGRSMEWVPGLGLADKTTNLLNSKEKDTRLSLNYVEYHGNEDLLPDLEPIGTKKPASIKAGIHDPAKEPDHINSGDSTNLKWTTVELQYNHFDGRRGYQKHATTENPQYPVSINSGSGAETWPLNEAGLDKMARLYNWEKANGDIGESFQN